MKYKFYLINRISLSTLRHTQNRFHLEFGIVCLYNCLNRECHSYCHTLWCYNNLNKMVIWNWSLLLLQSGLFGVKCMDFVTKLHWKIKEANTFSLYLSSHNSDQNCNCNTTTFYHVNLILFWFFYFVP